MNEYKITLIVIRSNGQSEFTGTRIANTSPEALQMFLKDEDLEAQDNTLIINVIKIK